MLIRKPIKELLEELDPDQFWQIHCATIVNTRAISGVVRGLRDQADLKLKGRNEILTVSRNFSICSNKCSVRCCSGTSPGLQLLWVARAHANTRRKLPASINGGLNVH